MAEDRRTKLERVSKMVGGSHWNLLEMLHRGSMSRATLLEVTEQLRLAADSTEQLAGGPRRR